MDLGFLVFLLFLFIVIIYGDLRASILKLLKALTELIQAKAERIRSEKDE